MRKPNNPRQIIIGYIFCPFSGIKPIQAAVNSISACNDCCFNGISISARRQEFYFVFHYINLNPNKNQAGFKSGKYDYGDNI